MNVLLTGSEGFIGTNVFLRLQNNQNTVVRADCNPGFGVHLKQDLRKSWGEFKGVDACIHLASVNTSNAPHDSNYLIQHNYELMKQAIVSCSKSKIRTLVVASSAAVYGNSTEWKTEDEEPKPLNEFGESVYQCEQLCEQWAADLGMTVISVRLCHVIGFRQTETSLPWQILKAIDEDKLFRVFGACYRPWTYVGDVSNFLITCAAEGRSILGTGHHVFNYSTSRVYSQMDLVDELASITGVMPQIAVESQRLVDPPVMIPRIDKAISIFGSRIIPHTELQVGLREVVSTFLHAKAQRAPSEVAFLDSLTGSFQKESSRRYS